MAEIPTTLIHLYMNPDGPFRSISELPDAEAFRLMDDMTESTEWHLPRFTPEKRKRYMERRRRTEQRLREAFTAKGDALNASIPITCSLRLPRRVSSGPQPSAFVSR